MNFLVGLLIVGVTMVIFLRVLSVLESGGWPSEKAISAGAALRELFLGRRTS